MSDITLKPCSACGKGTIHYREYPSTDEQAGYCELVCACCGHVIGKQGELSKAKNQVIEKWNSRPIEDGLREKLAQLIEQRNREFAEATDIIHDREAELLIKNEDIARKDEAIKRLNALVATQDAVMDCGYYTGPGGYPPTKEEQKYFDARDDARAAVDELREGGVE